MSSNQLVMILVVVAVLYVLTQSGYRKGGYSTMGNRSYNKYTQQKGSYYKSNAAQDISPRQVTPPAPAPAPTSAYGVNAYRDDNTKNYTAPMSGYKTNATANRKASVRPISGYEAVQPAPMKSAYSYGMAPVKF